MGLAPHNKKYSKFGDLNFENCTVLTDNASLGDKINPFIGFAKIKRAIYENKCTRK